MESKEFAESLKRMRNEAKKTVAEISAHLTQLGVKASEKTIYSWEAGRSQPTPDTLLDICKFYGVDDVLAAFGYKSIRGNNPLTSNLTPEGIKIAHAYEGADESIQVGVRKMLDVELDEPVFKGADLPRAKMA